ncbi:uncharacterized protein MELLADRAFT_46768 [Melampsora larici-populina 98AG31]|uniref:phosphatidylserine decarboxylase n=1 Tax=Melampsora larici-populina (strain 98AG31 / pathotype 3-4-7) TaxID=747676 RepID=F4R7Q8_MELLP|nr:uncharacterized protein MELLADRAFT_46768 [Melampsora larici-populina 98AG31]EGG11740.1 hypothetical protein MELLADRAFT_46768 [Melampsora larici-populina 98AG31]
MSSSSSSSPDNNNNNNTQSITPSQPIRSNSTFLTPPSPTTTTTNLVTKLKNHVPKRLSLSTSSRSKSSSSSSTHSISPIQSKHLSTINNNTVNHPIPAILKIRIEAGQDLLAKDRNGKSDPFCKLSLINPSNQNQVNPIILQEQSKLVSDIRYNTLNPIWYQSDLSLDIGSASIECIIFPRSILNNLVKVIVLDKDRLKNDYLGELEINLLDWIDSIGINSTSTSTFSNLSFNSLSNPPRWYSLVSSKSRTKVTGQLLVKIGFLSGLDFQTATSSLPTTVLSSLPFSSSPILETSNLEKTFAPKPNLSSSSEPPHPSKSVRLTEPTSPTIIKKPNRKFHQRLRKQKSEHSFKDGHLTKDDVMGICFIELDKAIGLPYWKSVTRIGFDMDPFVIISFGEKIFRTKVIRHSLEPVWDERLFFHVKREELNYTILFSLFDWDKMSSNDYIGEVKLPMIELIEANQKKMNIDSKTGLYQVDENGKLWGDSMINYEFLIESPSPSTSPLNSNSKSSNSSDLSNPSPPASATVSSTTTPSKLFIKAKYVPYSALRQVFWRKYLESFDTDESGTISKIELVSMLDSLGSTLSSETIESFFRRFEDGKPKGLSEVEIESKVLSFDQVICCLEDELIKKPEEKRKVKKRKVYDEERDLGMKSDGGETEEEEEGDLPCEVDKGIEDIEVEDPSPKEVEEEEEEEEEEEGKVEKVINISRCPICHKERINSRMEIDIVTHLAVCASTDWSSLRHILSPGNFVTSNQANRKWFTKVIGKVQNGKYSLGANSANIIVKDRITGRLVEEKMQVIVRVGIRLMYRSSGSKSRMEKEKVKKMLKSLTIKQGMKYNSIESRKEILGFIEFHELKLDEILRPIESFETFNEFFYRELKPGCRKIEGGKNEEVLVSCADCRMMVFENLGISKSIWIKGKSFSLKKVLGESIELSSNETEEEEEKWTIGIFRLAPQDYHRFHSPLDGVVEQIEKIDGQYYTVNPMAIRSTIDVYGENVRVIIRFQSKGFGKVYCVLVGAMMVGSIEVGVKVGDVLKKGDHLGYFAFGGSTILVIGESEMIEWDEDLLMNSKAPIETLVRVGNQVGIKKKKK